MSTVVDISVLRANSHTLVRMTTKTFETYCPQEIILPLDLLHKSGGDNNFAGVSWDDLGSNFKRVADLYLPRYCQSCTAYLL